MKIITILLLLSSISSFAQLNYVGEPFSKILLEKGKDLKALGGKDTVTDGVYEYCFQLVGSEENAICYFVNDTNLCIGLMATEKIALLEARIKLFNAHHIKVGDMKWVSKDGLLSYKITPNGDDLLILIKLL